MSRKRIAQSASPDPIAIGLEQDDDIIVVTPAKSAKMPRQTPTKRSTPTTTTTPTRQQPVAKVPSTRKRAANVPASTTPKKRTPLAKASPGPNDSVHEAAPRSASTKKSAARATPRSGKVKSTIASAVSQSLPTPSPARKGKARAIPAASPSASIHSTSDLDPFADPSSSVSAVSRETFLANEALRRQREARNFLYKGDSNAPRLTRSGKVVGDVNDNQDTADMDEYGDIVRDGDATAMDLDEAESQGMIEEEERLFPTRQDAFSPEAAEEASKAVQPLLPAARPHIIDILSTLTSQRVHNGIQGNEEEKNDAMQSLLKLLQGTVDRGEGNSALITGARGVGKTRAVNQALAMLSSGSKTSPIVVRLSGHAQTNDRLAIREMGKQIAEAEGRKMQVADDEEQADAVEEEYAPTTLPSHLLALLTVPSPRAIIIIIEEFDLFTEHARQALLYCLLDVVQSVKTGPVDTTGRGVAVIGVTSRVDTLLLLEKRVKSRFSHRMFRVVSPLASEAGWKGLLKSALIPWEKQGDAGKKDNKELRMWKDDWHFAVDMLLDQDKVVKAMDRLSGLTTDVRTIYRPFVVPMTQVLHSRLDILSIPIVAEQVLQQIELAGWGLQTSKLKGLPQPALGVLIIAKHLHYAGREEFNFAQVEEEYLRFARTKLVGSGKTRWPLGVLKMAFDQLLRTSLLSPASSSHLRSRFAKVRCTLSPHEVVAFFREGGAGAGTGLGPEMTSWGRMMGGHA